MSHNSPNLSLVVVFYEKELDMLALLAKSLNIYLDKNIFNEVIFIDNSFQQNDLKSRFSARVAPELGALLERTRYIKSSELNVNIKNKEDGYTTQQVLKFEIARIVANPFYLLLDAKNHLIRPLDYNQLFHSSGKPFSEFVNHSGYLETCRAQSFKFWNVELSLGEKCLPTITPYLVITQHALDMLESISSSQYGTLQSVIEENNKRTEFLLYAGWLYSLGKFEEFYAPRVRPSATLFSRWPEKNDDVIAVLNRCLNEKVYCLGVHINRYHQLTDEQKDLLIKFWCNYSLFPDYTAADSFIARQIVLYSRFSQDDVDVIIGNGGRLSLGQGTNNYLDQHLGKLTLDESQVFRWKYTLELRDSWCKARNVKYAYLVCPDTISIHTHDFIANDSVERPIMRIMKAKPNVSLIYPLNELKEASLSGIVCHTVDSHWTSFGAYVAYKQLQSKFPDLLKEFSDNEVSLLHKTGNGDLGDKFLPKINGELTECIVKNMSSQLVWNNGVNNRGYMSLWSNKINSHLPKAILLMDSYGWKLQRFLAESFSKMFVIHTPFFEFEAVELFKPDFVVNLQAERFIVRIPDDLSLEKAIHTATLKAPDSSWPNFDNF